MAVGVIGAGIAEFKGKISQTVTGTFGIALTVFFCTLNGRKPSRRHGGGMDVAAGFRENEPSMLF